MFELVCISYFTYLTFSRKHYGRHDIWTGCPWNETQVISLSFYLCKIQLFQYCFIAAAWFEILVLHRFVGICTERGGHGLRAWMTLRNVVQGQGRSTWNFIVFQSLGIDFINLILSLCLKERNRHFATGVEIMYELYSPVILEIECLRLEKRLDDSLAYLKDAPPEYSTVPFDYPKKSHPPGKPVPVNKTIVSQQLPHWMIRSAAKPLSVAKTLQVSKLQLKTDTIWCCSLRNRIAVHLGKYFLHRLNC